MGFNNIYLAFSLAIALVFFYAFLFAWLGFFYPFLVLLLTAITLWGLGKGKKIKQLEGSINHWEFLTLIIVVLFCLFTFIKTTPSYWGGRDPGAMVEAAVTLSENQRLNFSPPTLSLFNNQGADQLALNYPGFIFTGENELKTQFNIGYVAYLGVWYALGGELGLKMANLIGLFLGLLGIFSILRSLTRNSVAGIAGVILLIFSFPFFFLSRQNISEPMAFGFLFSAIWSLFYFKNSFPENRTGAWLALFLLFCFTLIRIEGILIFFIALFIIKAIQKKKKVPLNYKKEWLAFLIGLGIIFFLYSLSLIPFYQKLAKDLSGYQGGSFPIKLELAGGEKIFLKIYYLLRVFLKYGLAALTCLGLLGIISSFLKKKRTGKKNFNQASLFPFFLAGPFLIYFLIPSISLDHPWLLRRFLFAVLPLLLIYAVFFVYKTFKNKNFSFVILGLLLVFEIGLFINYGFLKENPRLIQEIEVISRQFGSNDLVVVDKSTAFNDWSLISEPMRYLFHKNAVYIYNPLDLEKLKTANFSKAYLIVSGEKVEEYLTYLKEATPEKEYTLNFEQLFIEGFDKEKGYVKPLSLPFFTREEKKIQVYQLNIPSNDEKK